MTKRPMTRINLDKAITRLANNDPRLSIDIRMSMANAIVGQFIPEGVVKGGTSLKFRYGSNHARYTILFTLYPSLFTLYSSLHPIHPLG